MTTQIINLSGYKFTALTDLETWKPQLIDICAAQGVKGTILLAPEGINLFIAGTREALETVLIFIRQMPHLADFKVKESPSPRQPFKRMLVKIKKEIIAFGVDQVNPERHPAPKISAQELKRWLDEGKPVTLLDTRNDYEVRVGTFRGAVIPHIWNFRDFPKAVRQLPPALKEQPVVMFCTGGIRCEKAGPFMELEGYTNILQLDGGILKYFEEVGGAHYDGECFVFDERVSVDAGLQPGSAVMCFNCQMPVTLAEQQDPRYVREKTCPHCFAGKPKGRGNTAVIAGEASA